MCGRVVVKSTGKRLKEALKLATVVSELPTPDYNLPPTREIPVVLNQGEGRELTLVRWGLVPPWTKELKAAPMLNNARAEGLTEKRTFARLLERRRCLVIADAFYEWKRTGTGKAAVKRPFAFARKDGQPLAFAGLWDTWHDPEGHTLTSCTIITCAANGTMKPVHDRMPVVLEPSAFDAWLDPEKKDPAGLTPLLAPADDAVLEAVEVGSEVNSVKNNGPKLLEPKTEP